MEPPSFRETCAKLFCNKVDFIPIRCDQCNSIFCYEHIAYKDHTCNLPISHGLQIPMCPLCNLSYSRGLYGNLEIAAIIHVEQECESAIAVARRKVFDLRTLFI
ncbi:AN1-type zinc finger protein 2B isoform X2 [Halyomorpha halys]|uniref:AN1-type zinc finger protein 2B isoform X2 n=1 Tax=Halyomorpha halys TaxID=286706 RepID=UPI0034D2998F